MADKALSKGKVVILLEKILKEEFLKIYLLGILTGCILGMAASKCDIPFILAGLIFTIGAGSLIYKFQR